MPEPPRCPFCDARGAEQVSQFGSQILTSQWQCRACGSYFEAVRDEFAPRRRAPAADER